MIAPFRSPLTSTGVAGWCQLAGSFYLLVEGPFLWQMLSCGHEYVVYFMPTLTILSTCLLCRSPCLLCPQSSRFSPSMPLTNLWRHLPLPMSLYIFLNQDPFHPTQSVWSVALPKSLPIERVSPHHSLLTLRKGYSIATIHCWLALTCCYGLNEYVPLKFICWNPNPQRRWY